MRKMKSSALGRLTRDMLRDVMGTAIKEPFQTGELRKNPREPAWHCPAGYSYELIPAPGFEMEYLQPEDVVTGRVVLQLHGGGYIGPMKNIYRSFEMCIRDSSYSTPAGITSTT